MGTLDLNEDDIRGIANDMGVNLSEDELGDVTGGLADLSSINIPGIAKEALAKVIAKLIMKGVSKEAIMKALQQGIDITKLDPEKFLKP